MFKWFGKVNFVPYTKVGEFAEHLKNGKIMGTKCKQCGTVTFPPRADCEKCMESDWEFIQYGGKAKLVTFTQIFNLPWGFDQRFLVIGIGEFENGVKAMGQIAVDSIAGLTLGLEMQPTWDVVRVQNGENVYGLVFKPLS